MGGSGIISSGPDHACRALNCVDLTRRLYARVWMCMTIIEIDQIRQSKTPQPHNVDCCTERPRSLRYRRYQRRCSSLPLSTSISTTLHCKAVRRSCAANHHTYRRAIQDHLGEPNLRHWWCSKQEKEPWPSFLDYSRGLVPHGVDDHRKGQAGCLVLSTLRCLRQAPVFQRSIDLGLAGTPSKASKAPVVRLITLLTVTGPTTSPKTAPAGQTTR